MCFLFIACLVSCYRFLLLFSFGKVFLVRPIRAPQSEVYAMKVLRKSEVVKRHQVEHTLTERYILATVRHPFILCLRHAFQTNDKLYMVTDYCPGGELFFHLKRLRRFTEGMSCCFIALFLSQSYNLADCLLPVCLGFSVSSLFFSLFSLFSFSFDSITS
jgi:serine/threonine protein kinase